MSFEIKIPLFQGPFDLLIFFIKRDELDIHDIPIAKITKDFLDYTHRLRKINIELASEFVLMAATLMNIKAKMLLPRPKIDKSGEEIDPRSELVQHLLEYKKYKAVVPVFEDWENAMLQREKRGNIMNELARIADDNHIELALQKVDIYKLLKTYQNLLEKHQEQKKYPTHQVIPYAYTVEVQKKWIIAELSMRNKLSFDQVLSFDTDRIAIIFNFLAILELISTNCVTLILGEGFNNFWIHTVADEQQ